MRNEALLAGDKLAGELAQATDPALRQQLAEKLTFQQMLANTMDDEAYVTGGGVKGFALGKKLTNAFEQYEALLDQIGMIAHTVHAAGGVLEAARSYELFKYVNRICVLFEQAGVKDERLAFFKNWSELVYRVDREATGALDRLEGAKLAGGAGKASVRTDAGAPQVAPSDSFLLDNYQRFGEMVEQQGEALGKRAQAEAAGAGGADAGGSARPPIGAPQLLRLPRPTEADGVHAPSPAAPSRVSGDGMALLARLTQAKQTLEQELEATKDFPAQNAAARRTLD
jgi:hypothetical protein